MKTISRATLALALAATVARAQPSISFEQNQVVVDVEPRTGVVLAGAGQFFVEGITSLIDGREVLFDDDGDGSVALDVGREVPEDSVWLAVTPEGKYTYASPGDVGALVTEFPDASLDYSGSFLSRLLLNKDRGVLLVSRPGGPAWEITADDGGSLDHDGSYNGAVELESRDMWGVGGHEVLNSEFLAGDIVAFFDLQGMHLSVIELTLKDIESRTVGGK